MFFYVQSEFVPLSGHAGRFACEILQQEIMEHVTGVLELAIDTASRVTAAFPESKQIFSSICNSTEWLKITAVAFLESNQISSETLCVVTMAALVAVMFTWCVSNGSKQIYVTDPESPRPNEVISIFELAKTAYAPGHADQVITLVNKLHFDVNFPIPVNGMTLFLCACISGHKGLVRFLLERGGDVSVTNRHGDTCLYLATFACAGSPSSDLSTVEHLLLAGCDVNAQNHKGNTALHWAASRGHVSMVKLLLKHGADPNIRNNIGMYPIGIATNAGHLRAGKLLKINLPDPSTPWDMFEPHTPVQVKLGLLSPHKDHLALSPRPRMRLNLS